MVRRIQLGSQLRQLRRERGITLQTAGDSARVSETKMSRMELGRVSFKRRDVENLLTLYGITDEQARAGILSLAEEANTPGWWQQYSDVVPGWWATYLGLEGAASLIRAYEVQHVPALLQTEEYAHVVCQHAPRASQAEVERRVALRLERQQALVADDACELHVVLDESALQRTYGQHAVMRRQVQYLIDASQRPNVRLQIMPFHSMGHPVGAGSFTLFSFSQVDLSDVVYVEQLTSALYMDKPEDVARYTEIHEELQRASPAPEGSRHLLRGLAVAA
ncbi:helix-turn-helix domain-containing protein [Streptomyces pseudovenezuelae]|uniref:helix-turn-helix domain-containing protein n=1 Tax=Streptomyces pseudovenezuelae TaxID=67350 RepID=UPI002E36D11C|nr:helix-turn-helix transcriptional regulator [Streptomyces pseudovenezuelae]